MQSSQDPRGPRTQATRAAILAAFVRLVFARRYDGIRIADLAAEAGVGRATFYEHFRGKEEVLLAAMEPILLSLAGAASGARARPSYARCSTMSGKGAPSRGLSWVAPPAPGSSAGSRR